MDTASNVTASAHAFQATRGRIQTGAEELRLFVKNMDATREDFLDRFTAEQLISIFRMQLASGWDFVARDRSRLEQPERKAGIQDEVTPRAACAHRSARADRRPDSTGHERGATTMCKVSTLTANSPGIAITIEASPSDLEIRGNASAIEDEKLALWIESELEDGNMWAWCEVTVTVTYRDTLTARAYLGGCSYKSERDFRHDNGYFGDLVKECIDRLNADLVVLCGPGKGA